MTAAKKAAAWLALLIRANPLFCVALAAGAALRTLAAVAYQGVIWFYADSYVYLGTALRPRPDLTKTVGYSFFLRALEPLRSFSLVAASQHLMGLAAAVMMYALLRRARLPAWAATLATLPALFDGYELDLEQMLMSDTLFAFLIMVAVTLIMWRHRPGPRLMLAAGLLLGCAVTVRSAALPLIAVAGAYLLVHRVGWRPVTAVAVGGVAPIALYAVWFHSWTGQYQLTRSDGFFLWGRVSSFAECAQIDPPSAERRLCLSTPPRHRLPPGTLIWRNVPPRQLPGGPVAPRSNKLMRDFAVRAIEAQPGAYLWTIGHDVGLAFYWHRLPYPNATTAREYLFPLRPQVAPAGHAWVPGGTAAHDVRSYGRADPNRVLLPLARLLRAYQKYIFTPGPLLGSALLAGLCGLARFRRRLGGAVALPWAAAVALLLFPIATADFSYRYLLPVLPFAFLAAALAFAPPPEAEKPRKAATLTLPEKPVTPDVFRQTIS